MKKIENTETILERFKQDLTAQNKAPATVEKYLRDARAFLRFSKNQTITADLLLSYRTFLSKTRTANSANSVIAAANSFFRFCGKKDLRIKPFKMQRKIYCSEEKELTKEEYRRLVHAADERIALLLQTVCSTGIRISELEFITLEAAKTGESTVRCKGKSRTVFLIPALRKKLIAYAKKKNIHSGALFITKSGRPMNRSNIWKAMKRLCGKAGVSPSKVFPHNLRHLFARIFYGIEKDVVKLADILGHSDINTTRIYIVTTGSEHRKRMERLRLIL